MIFDAFTYYNETEILRIRLQELEDVVDRFVILESEQTFTGLEKPLYFDDLPEWIHRWKDQIIRVVVPFPKQDMTAWEREAFQRNYIDVVLDDIDGDDTIIISDADEIPRPSTLPLEGEPVQLDVTQYFWNAHWEVPAHCNQGGRPVVCKRRDLNGAHYMRTQHLPRIPDAGWHFSFYGAVNPRDKIEAFSHTEYDLLKFKRTAHAVRCIEEGIDPFDRFPLKWTPIGSSHPMTMQLENGKLS